MLQILFIIFGLIALTKNEFTLVGKRKVTGSHAKMLGAFMLIGGIAGFLFPLAILITCPGVIIIGLVVAQKPVDDFDDLLDSYEKPKNTYEKPKNTLD